MAIGQPKLLTWRAIDKALRLYEYSPTSGFVQIATGSAGSGISNAVESASPPFFKFVNDSEHVLAIPNMDYGPEAVGSRYRAHRRLLSANTLTTISGLAPSSYTDSFVLRETAITSRFSNFALTPDSSTNAQGAIEAVSYNGTTLTKVDGLDDPLTQNPSPTFTIMHPYDEFILVVQTGIPIIIPRIGHKVVNGQRIPVYIPKPFEEDNGRSRVRLDEIAGEIKSADWSPNGKYLFIGTSTGSMYVYEVSTSEIDTAVYTVKLLYREEYPHRIVRIKISQDSKWAAVSTHNNVADTYTCVIYKLSGPILVPVLTLANFGKLLHWSHNSKMLIDAGMRKMVIYNDVLKAFEDKSSQMANVVAGAEWQSVSTHAPSLVHIGHVFTKAAKEIAANSGGIDVNNLRVRLYSRDAKFVTNATSILGWTNVYGNYEVYGGKWPQGGKKLENVSIGDTASGVFALKADDLEQILLDNLTFRHAVVYDATNGFPVAWYDLLSDVTAQVFKMLRFDLSEFGIVSFK